MPPAFWYTSHDISRCLIVWLVARWFHLAGRRAAATAGDHGAGALREQWCRRVSTEYVCDAWSTPDRFIEAGGQRRALINTVNVTVADGQLTIGFTRIVGKDNPAINAIEVLPQGSSVRRPSRGRQRAGVRKRRVAPRTPERSLQGLPHDVLTGKVRV